MTAPVKITIEGEPIPKARPRVVRGKVWTPTHDAENGIALLMRSSGFAGRFKGKTPLIVTMLFIGAKKQADIDNLGKLYLDALVKSDVIPDDRYVCGLWLERKEIDVRGPRTEITVGEYQPTG